MPKKPKFEDLPESSFTNNLTAVPTSGSGSRRGVKMSTSPMREQSEESKVIKRVNEQMKQLSNYIPPDDNNYFAAYKKALDKSGVEYTRKTDANGIDRYVIRNTKENREKVDALRRELDRNKARSMRDLRREAIQEVKGAGKKVTEENIKERLKYKRAFAELESNADFVYAREGKNGGGKLSKIIDKMRGYSRKNDPSGYEKLVLELSEAVKKSRREERQQATRKSRIKTDTPY